MIAQIIFLIISFTLTLFFFLYGFNLYFLLYQSGKYKSPRLPKKDFDQRPNVSIHLPVYNEKYVIRDLISACWHMAEHYGIDKVKIMIIDDSNDGTIEEIDEVVDSFSQLKIEVLRRGNRLGYKAGALQAAIDRTEEEFIAIFDADFIPPPDFLVRTIPFLISEKKLGIVQSRWTHLNREYNSLTRAISIGIDVHFLIEQPARYALNCFQNFNGSGGVIRKSALLEAGGWQADTLAEDLDMSYRMQMAGYHILYLKDLQSPGEVPPTVPGYKKQQGRWACGSLRTARKLLPVLLAKREIGFKQRLQAFLHLTNYLVHPLMFISFLLACLATLFRVDTFRLPQTAFLFSSSVSSTDILRSMPLVLLVLLILLSAIAAWVTPVVALQREHLSISKNLSSLLTLFLLGCGLSLNNTIEAGKALFSNRIWSFQRTPKYALKNGGEKWQEKSYQVPLDFEVLLELVLTGLGSYAIGLAVWRSEFAVLLILVPYTVAYAFVFLQSIRQSRPEVA